MCRINNTILYPGAMTINRSYRAPLALRYAPISPRLFRLRLHDRPKIRRCEPDAHRPLGKQRDHIGVT